MFKRTLLSLGLSLSIISLPVKSQDKKCFQPYRSPFRYVIYNNQLYSFGRSIDVLLDEKSFSEKTLRELFQLVAEKYPEPKHLVINVVTDLDVALTPEERDAPAISEVEICGGDRMDKYHRAIFIRSSDGSGVFRVKPSPPRRDMEVV